MIAIYGSSGSHYKGGERMFFDSMSNGGVYPLRAGWIVLALIAVAMVAAQIH